MVQVKTICRIVAFLLFLVIFPLTVSAITGVSNSYNFAFAVALIQDPRYKLSYQFSYSSSIGMYIGITHTIGAALRGGVSIFSDSPFTDGVQYRGFSSLFGSVLFDVSFAANARSDKSRIGSQIGVRFDYAQYASTSLYLFFPGIEVVPYAGYTTGEPGSVTFRIGLPLLCFFRKDLDIFISTGICITVLI